MRRKNPLTEHEKDIILQKLVGKLTKKVQIELLAAPTVQLKEAMSPLLDGLHLRADADTVTFSYDVHLGVKYLRGVLKRAKKHELGNSVCPRI